jgi:hypothetical protein
MSDTTMKVKPNSRLETLVIMLSFAAILIPLRVITKEVFADGWLGSLGVLTAVITAIIVLSHKDKLGWYGKAFMRQITKMHKGKKRYFFFAQTSVFILFGVFIVSAITVGNSEEYIDVKNQVLDQMRSEGIPVESVTSTEPAGATIEDRIESVETQFETMESVMEMNADVPIERQIETVVALPVIAVKEFHIIGIAFAISNDLMGGWMLYLWQVILIESIEFMGIYIVTKKYVKTEKTE